MKRPVYNKLQVCQRHMNISSERPDIPVTVFAAKLNDTDIRVLFLSAPCLIQSPAHLSLY